jgi:hypothetical protein
VNESALSGHIRAEAQEIADLWLRERRPQMQPRQEDAAVSYPRVR